ncbi:MAG: carbamoyltransferase [Verrucomicrobiae bacterium]|nr:carbamoyltransferase [Verrucomicrobiae bacterium]
MYILGISAFYHDSAAALLKDGEIIAAAQEERFTRKKHDLAFPEQAIEYCLKEAGISLADVKFVSFYEKPLQKFDRLIETYLAFAPAGFKSFSKAIPLWAKEKLFQRREMRRKLPGYKGPFVYPEHHESHAASAFFPSPFDRAAVLTIDGVGEWASASIGLGEGNKLRLVKEMHFPHSAGLLYSAFTYYTGFRVNSGEYKLMGLAPYGEPRFADVIREKLVRVYDDGSIWLDMDYFNYCQGLTMTSEKFHQLFGRPPRTAETDLSQLDMDLAASIQVVTEEIMVKMARYAREITGANHLCLAGGVALNCVGNGKILREKIFDEIWIQPAAGDAGGALGAAQFVWHHLLERERKPDGRDSQKGSYLGSQPTREETESFLKSAGAKWHHHDNEKALLDSVAAAMADGKVVGWSSGRMEYGPRALGARSIIGDARSEGMQSVMNRKIKFRESFRPFAPCVLKEDVADYFDLEGESPYMLLVAPVKEAIRTPLTPEEEAAMKDPDLRKRVNVKRSELPAITHVDYSARIQTVDEERHGRYCRLMKRFKELTGCAVIINTSFNIRGEPIVRTPEEAYNCFMKTHMDVLVIEDCVLFKSEQANVDEKLMEDYRESFPLD